MPTEEAAPISSEKKTTAILSREQLENLVSPEHLKVIAQSSDGFTFRANFHLEGMGQTDLETKVIEYNPRILSSVSRNVARMFFYHEAGHHTPSALDFQNRLLSQLDQVEIPEKIRGNPASEKRFVYALQRHFNNTFADVWDEAYLGRRPFYLVEDIIDDAYGEIVGSEGRDFLKKMPKPEQFCQAIVGEARHLPLEKLKGLVDDDVSDAVKRTVESGGLRVIQDRAPFENYFSTEASRKSLMAKKARVTRDIFLPEYLKLVEAELDQKKEEEPQKSLDELIEELLQEIEKAAEKYGSQAPSEEEQEKVEQKLGEIGEAIDEQYGEGDKEKKGTDKKETPDQSSPEQPGLESLERRAAEIRRKAAELAARGLAESAQVKEESVQRWVQIKEKYKEEIKSTASVLADVFLEDRRFKLEFLRREGEIVPGLEAETISAMLSGELDPATKMETIRNPEFLETEIEFVVDTSGSMMGEKIASSVEAMVILVESFKQVREILIDEDLVEEGDFPFRIGVTKFTTEAERVSGLEEPISDKKELQIIDKVSEIGGGTDEEKALEKVYKGLKLKQGNIIKFIIVFTDGFGNRESVVRIVQQVEKDGEVIFLAVGLGDDATAVQEVYSGPLKEKNKNVSGIDAVNPKQALPDILDFIKREVGKRRS